MGLDAAILRSAQADRWHLRFYRWSGPAVTFGYSQPWALADAAAKRRFSFDVPAVRRSTGGGIVIHDGDITFSLVFPWERLSSPCLIYKNIHRGVHVGLKAIGITTALWSPRVKEAPKVRGDCFTAPEPIDMVDESGKKLLGGALRKRGGRGLYQGSFRPLDWGKTTIELEQAMTAGLELEFGAVPNTDFGPANCVPAIREEGRRQAERYRSLEWNHRR